jgi:hypothetical protein
MGANGVDEPAVSREARRNGVPAAIADGAQELADFLVGESRGCRGACPVGPIDMGLEAVPVW